MSLIYILIFLSYVCSCIRKLNADQKSDFKGSSLSQAPLIYYHGIIVVSFSLGFISFIFPYPGEPLLSRSKVNSLLPLLRPYQKRTTSRASRPTSSQLDFFPLPPPTTNNGQFPDSARKFDLLPPTKLPVSLHLVVPPFTKANANTTKKGILVFPTVNPFHILSIDLSLTLTLTSSQLNSPTLPSNLHLSFLPQRRIETKHDFD
jgi:hypothetical protein